MPSTDGLESFDPSPMEMDAIPIFRSVDCRIGGINNERGGKFREDFPSILNG
jgi:hypothetical protein